MGNSWMPKKNDVDPRDFASTVGKPPRNVATMPNLLRAQDKRPSPFLENHPLKLPLRKSLKTLPCLQETNQRPEHPGVYLGSHGYTAHHLPCTFSFSPSNSHLPIRNLLFGPDPYSWHSRLYFNSHRLGHNLKLHQLVSSLNVHICTFSVGPTHRTQPLRQQACYVQVYSSIHFNHSTILRRVHPGTQPP